MNRPAEDQPLLTTALLSSDAAQPDEAIEGCVEELVRDSASSADKALALLSVFGPTHRVMGVSELARRAALPKSTAHRLLAVLVRWNLLSRDGTMYSTGPKLVELAALSSTRKLRDAALPYLQDLYESTHETVHLAILQDNDVLYVEKLFGHNSVKSPSQVGGRVPANCTAIGKVMLAHSYQGEQPLPRITGELPRLTTNSIGDPRRLQAELVRIRQDGTALDRQEAAVGLTCIAGPVIGPSGDLLGAISVAGPVQRFRPAAVNVALRCAALGIGRAYSRRYGRGPYE